MFLANCIGGTAAVYSIIVSVGVVLLLLLFVLHLVRESVLAHENDVCVFSYNSSYSVSVVVNMAIITLLKRLLLLLVLL